MPLFSQTVTGKVIKLERKVEVPATWPVCRWACGALLLGVFTPLLGLLGCILVPLVFILGPQQIMFGLMYVFHGKGDGHSWSGLADSFRLVHDGKPVGIKVRGYLVGSLEEGDMVTAHYRKGHSDNYLVWGSCHQSEEGTIFRPPFYPWRRVLLGMLAIYAAAFGTLAHFLT